MTTCITNYEIFLTMLLILLRGSVLVLLVVYGVFQIRKLLQGKDIVPRALILSGILFYLFAIIRIALIEAPNCRLITPTTFGFNFGIIIIIVGLIALSRKYRGAIR